METEKEMILAPVEVIPPLQRYSRAQMALGLGVAAVSDILMVGTEFVPPIQWALDGATALALYFILGRRKALLAGLILEAIPGMGVFPAWIFVVLSILLYDGIRRPQRA